MTAVRALDRDGAEVDEGADVTTADGPSQLGRVLELVGERVRVMWTDGSTTRERPGDLVVIP